MAMTKKERERIKKSMRTKDYVTVDGVKPAVSYVATYYSVLLKMLDRMNTYVELRIYPVLKREEARLVNSAEFKHADAYDLVKNQMAQLKNTANSFDVFAQTTARRMVDSNNEYHKRAFTGEINSRFGVDLNRFRSKKKASRFSVSVDKIRPEKNVNRTLNKSIKSNVKLIKDLPKKQYTQIENILKEGLAKGDSAPSLRKQLENIEGITKRRAKFIAIDQTQKLIGDLNRVRQENEGVTRYEWDANVDARTRSAHQSNNGNVYSWDDRTPGDALGPPGLEPRCRCVANPVIEDEFLKKILDDLEN